MVAIRSRLLTRELELWARDLNEVAGAGLGFGVFKRAVWPAWQDAQHFEILDRYLEDVARYVETEGREGTRMAVVEMPPRHGKSTTIARLFPAWFLGRNPNMRVILASHTMQLAQSHSRWARNLMEQPAYQSLYRARLAEDRRAVQEWNLARPYEGGMTVMGMLGSIVGSGANLLIIDDPFKRREEAESATIREKMWDAFTSDFFTREDRGGATGIILLSQRWHVDDLIGRVIEREAAAMGGRGYARLTMRALAEAGEDDPLARAPGEALWPERFSAEHLRATRLSIGEYHFRSMYQQQPYTRSGGLWQEEWIDGGRLPNGGQPWNLERIIVAVDPAATANIEASETGIVVVARGEDGRGYVLEDASLRGTPAQWAARAIEAYDHWGADAVIAEVNQGGDMVEHTLRQARAALPIRQVRASRGKVARAEPISSLYERGQVSHVGQFAELESQLLTYTGNSRDASPDRLDALCWGMHELFPQHGHQRAIKAGIGQYEPRRRASRIARRGL